jgi:hypothetical protein
MKHHSTLILIGFLTLGGAFGCGAHDGNPGDAGNTDGTDTTATDGSGRAESLRHDPESYGRKGTSGERDYLRVVTPEPSAADSCCGGVETETDATVYVSPSGSDDAPGTHDEPVFTLARAIRLAADRGHSVVVRP